MKLLLSEEGGNSETCYSDINCVDFDIFPNYVKTCKFTVFPTDSFCQVYRVTDEALIAETAVWPNFLLMNIFFALKGSKLFIIIQYVVLRPE